MLSKLMREKAAPEMLEMVNGVPQYRLDDPKTLAWYQRVADFINKDNCQPNADRSADAPEPPSVRVPSLDDRNRDGRSRGRV